MRRQQNPSLFKVFLAILKKSSYSPADKVTIMTAAAGFTGFKYSGYRDQGCSVEVNAGLFIYGINDKPYIKLTTGFYRIHIVSNLEYEIELNNMIAAIDKPVPTLRNVNDKPQIATPPTKKSKVTYHTPSPEVVMPHSPRSLSPYPFFNEKPDVNPFGNPDANEMPLLDGFEERHPRIFD